MNSLPTKRADVLEPGDALEPRRSLSLRHKLGLLLCALIVAAQAFELLLRLVASRHPSWLAIYRNHPAVDTYTLQANAQSLADGNPLNLTYDHRGMDKPATSITWMETARFVHRPTTNTGGTRVLGTDGNCETQGPSGATARSAGTAGETVLLTLDHAFIRRSAFCHYARQLHRFMYLPPESAARGFQ